MKVLFALVSKINLIFLLASVSEGFRIPDVTCWNTPWRKSFLKTSLDNQSQKTNSNNKSEKLLPGEISLYVFVKGVFLPLPATKGHTRYFESTKPLRLLASVM